MPGGAVAGRSKGTPAGQGRGASLEAGAGPDKREGRCTPKSGAEETRARAGGGGPVDRASGAPQALRPRQPETLASRARSAQ